MVKTVWKSMTFIFTFWAECHLYILISSIYIYDQKLCFWNSSKQRPCQILWNHFASEMWHSLFMPPESQRGPQKKPNLLYFVFCNKCASAYASIRIGISLRKYKYKRAHEKKGNRKQMNCTRWMQRLNSNKMKGAVWTGPISTICGHWM